MKAHIIFALFTWKRKDFLHENKENANKFCSLHVLNENIIDSLTSQKLFLVMRNLSIKQF
ncbi:hypothetical protein DZB84_23255 [Bacillus sp. HNG]|nr:hypothetical protein DZB84_23255 [Bacillus sp. HNG]